MDQREDTQQRHRQQQPWRPDDHDESLLLASSSSSSEDTCISVVADDNAPLLREPDKKRISVPAYNDIDNLSNKSAFILVASALALVCVAFIRSAGSASSSIEHRLIASGPNPAQYDASTGTTDTNAVRSLSHQNILNLNGHYLHDEHRSPYASPLYDTPDDVLQSIQEAYIKKMTKVREEWGAWSFVDPSEDQYGPMGRDRPITDFTGVPYKDLPAEQFVDGSWQTDQNYVYELIAEAKRLVHRVKEGIYAEYGHPAQTRDGAQLSEEETAKREEMFRLITDEFKLCKGKPIPLDDSEACKKSSVPLPGIGYWRQEAFDELAKKLLHAMMSQDDFYVVLGGHSSAAGHGNNFMQSKMMQFHYIMEPVFAKLGVRLVSRNMAMGGVGTLGSAMGGKDIYGEADIMIWDSQMTEREKGVHDLFNRQAILSGERVPVLLMPNENMYDIEEQSDKSYIWGGGDVISTRSDFDTGLLEKTQDEEQAQNLPYAVRYMGCESGSDGLCKDHIYNSECWVRRSDYNPSKKTKMEKHVGGRASWHPGNRVHQLIGRKWSLIVLYALEKALDDFKSGIEADGIPLADQYWHVGRDYEEIREKLQLHVPSNENELSRCEEHFDKFPIVCHTAMHAFTEWTPRVLPDERSLRAILKKGSNGYAPVFDDKNAYDGPDILPPKWKIPEGEIDVHAIAIATNFPPGIASGTSSSVTEHSLRKLLQAKPLQTQQAYSTNFRNRRNTVHVDRIRRKLKHFDLDESSRLVSITPMKDNGRRYLSDGPLDGEVLPGDGWVYSGGRAGFCDGSFQSECQREVDSTCPMKGHSDGRSGLIGDALSGWLVFDLPRIKEGVIIARLEVWHDGSKVSRTEGWTEINNGGRGYTGDGPSQENDPKEPQDRRLNVPENDFYFDISINGVIRTMDYEEFMSHKPNYGQNMSFWPLLLPKDREAFNQADGPVELAIRLRSSAGRDATVLISHIYYA